MLFISLLARESCSMLLQLAVERATSSSLIDCSSSLAVSSSSLILCSSSLLTPSPRWSSAVPRRPWPSRAPHACSARGIASCSRARARHSRSATAGSSAWAPRWPVGVAVRRGHILEENEHHALDGVRAGIRPLSQDRRAHHTAVGSRHAQPLALTRTVSLPLARASCDRPRSRPQALPSHLASNSASARRVPASGQDRSCPEVQARSTCSVNHHAGGHRARSTPAFGRRARAAQCRPPEDCSPGGHRPGNPRRRRAAAVVGVSSRWLSGGRATATNSFRLLDRPRQEDRPAAPTDLGATEHKQPARRTGIVKRVALSSCSSCRSDVDQQVAAADEVDPREGQVLGDVLRTPGRSRTLLATR